MKAVVPGSFDPVTFGHLDVIERASFIFSGIVVAVIDNGAKKHLFTLEERAYMLEEVTAKLPNVHIDTFSGLLVAYMKKEQANVIVRGLRALSDFEYELQMALMNHELDPGVETVFLAASFQYSFLSSSLVKEIASSGGPVRQFVPPVVEERLREKFRSERGWRKSGF